MKDILFKYLPEKSVDLVYSFLKKHRVLLKIVNQRKSKHGDYRFAPNRQHIITVNASLNKYKFLLTLVHEFAHLVCAEKYSLSIKPHGEEWKNSFGQLMKEYLSPDIFPEDILDLLQIHMLNPSASSDRDIALSMAMTKYEVRAKNISLVYELPIGSHFQTQNGRIFEKGELRTKKYICKELETNRLYIFSPSAEVKLLNKKIE